MVYFITAIFVSLSAFSQPDSVMYSHDFKFKQGIYLHYEDFKKNKPLLKSKIISTLDKSQLRFLGSVVTKGKIIYLDDSGTQQTVKTNDIWGYCENNSVYINFIYNNYSNGFQKVQVIGSICHLTAEIEYLNNDPFDTGGFNSVPRYYKEMRQFVIDFSNGKMYDFNSENMAALLKMDKRLYNEFSILSKKKRAEMIFVYLRKFNDTHPIYFPE